MNATVTAIVQKHSLAVFSLGLLAALALYYLPWLCGQSFYMSDICFYFEPLANFVADSIRHGKLPLWNPLSYCGMSQVAIPSPGIFYPFNLLFAALPFSTALALIMLLHQLIAGIGSYLFIRRLNWQTLSCVVAGLVYSLSGYMFSLQTQYTLVAAASWLPWCLWSVVCLTSTKNKLPYTLYLTIATFLLLSAGRPEISVPSIALIAAVSIYLIGTSDEKAKNSFALALALASGCLMAAPELLPALEWKELSRRGAGLRQESIFYWSAGWYDVISMVIAYPLGNLNELGCKYLSMVSGVPGRAALPFVASTLVGFVTVTLAIWGALDKTWKYRYWVLTLFIFSLALCLGNQTPIAPGLVEAIPALAIVRYPVKLMFLPIACLSLLAARGTTFYTGGGDKIQELSAWLFWLATLATGVILMAPVLHIDGNPELQARLLIGTAITSTAAIALVFCFLTKRLQPSSTQRTLLMTFLLITLLIPALQYRQIGPANFYSHPKLSTVLDQLGLKHSSNSRIAILYGHPALSMPWRLKDDGSMADYFYYGRQVLMPNSHMDVNQPVLFAFEGAETNNFYQLCNQTLSQSTPAGMGSLWPKDDLPLSTLCRLSSADYAIGHIYYLDPQRKARSTFLPFLDPSLFELVSQDWAMNIRIYKVNKALARARFVKANPQLKVEDITYATSSEIDPETDLSGNDITWLSNNPNQMSLSAKSQDGKYLLIADQHYPGWQAKVDNQPAEIALANAFQKSIYIPAGKHTVNLDFRPESFNLGLQLGSLGFAICLILAIASLGHQGRIMRRSSK